MLTLSQILRTKTDKIKICELKEHIKAIIIDTYTEYSLGIMVSYQQCHISARRQKREKSADKCNAMNETHTFYETQKITLFARA